MEHYQKVQKTKEDTAENEIRVAAGGQVSKYLGYAFRILNRSTFTSITVRATGNAIVKALILIELVKRRIGDLHQLNKIHSMMIVDKYEPKIEGLDPIEQTRRVTAFDCILSKDPLDENDLGYQKPREAEERQPNRTTAPPAKRGQPAPVGVRGRGIRGRGRGHNEERGRGARRYNDDTEVAADVRYARGRKEHFYESTRPEERRGREPERARGIRGRGRGREDGYPAASDPKTVERRE